MRFAIRTLGCKVNRYEEQVLRENLERSGFRETSLKEADLFIVNSCTVTEKADLKTRKLIRKARKENPEARIIVTGCYAVFPEDISRLESMDEVFRVVPLRDKMKLPLIVSRSFGGGEQGGHVDEKVTAFGGHTRAFLKVQDGCDQGCAYCKVSLVRGPSRSRDEDDILDEVKRLSGSGYREIVITGICLGSWKTEKKKGLSGLLRLIERLPGDFRVRLSSIEPQQIDEELVDLMSSSERVCRHLHIPLQSGSDRVLKLMNRRYTTGWFKEKIESIRKKMPLAGITMDVIAGFPGETEEDLDLTKRFLEQVRPSRLHVFKYSDRKGTRAYKAAGKVSSVEAKNRVEKLISLGRHLQREFAIRFIGRPVDVMVEEKGKGGFLEGYTGEYVRVRLEGFDGAEGDILKVVSHSLEEDECLLRVKRPSQEVVNTHG